MRGGMKYNPKEVIKKLEEYKFRYNVGDSVAFKMICQDADIGHNIRQKLGRSRR